MSNFHSDVHAAIEGLRTQIGHDKLSAEMLDKLVEHVNTSAATISIEKAINERVSSVYAIEHRAVSPRDEALERFSDLFTASLSRLGYLMSLARSVPCDEMQIEYLTAKIEDAVKGAYIEDLVPYTIPTRADADQSAEAIENFVAPLVEMTQRVLNVQSDRNAFPHNLKQAKFLLGNKLASQRSHQKAIDTYSEAEEAAFQLEMDEKIAIEQHRLNSYRANGTIVEAVEINPMFGPENAYEDTLLYNLQILTSRRDNGSNSKWAYEHAKQESERLELEIIELRENIQRLEDEGQKV